MAVIFDQRGRPIDDNNPFPVTVEGSSTLGRESLVFTGGSVASLQSIPAAAKEAFGVVEGAAIRVWADGGSDPTTTDGILYNDGDSITILTADDLTNFRAVSVDGNQVTIHLLYA